jgi:hypothetical protein
MTLSRSARTTWKELTAGLDILKKATYARCLGDGMPGMPGRSR